MENPSECKYGFRTLNPRPNEIKDMFLIAGLDLSDEVIGMLCKQCKDANVRISWLIDKMKLVKAAVEGDMHGKLS